MRALVVDDSATMRRLLQELLKERGHGVVTTETGEAGLAEHRRAPFDLMLIDWTLPGMSGLDLCRQVREMRGGDDPVILIVTARDRPEDLTAVLDAGASDYLAKPIDPDILRTRLLVCERRAQEALRRRWAERALRITEARFKNIAENVPGVVFRCRLEDDGALRFTYLSEGSRDVFGVSADDVLREPSEMYRRIPGDEQLRLREAFTRSARNLEPLRHDLRTTLADGSEHFHSVLARPHRAGDGVSWDGLIIDVTQMKRVEAAHRRSQESFRQLIEASPDSILVHHDRKFVYVNPSFLRLLGYEGPDEVIGRDVLLLVHPDDHSLVHDRKARYLSKGSPTPAQDIHFVRRDGGRVVAECIGIPLEFGGEASVLVIARDLTERREAQSRLLLADRMASMGTLAAGVAHELNNPLAYVVSNLRLLREELDPQRGPLAELLEETAAGVDRIAAIVSDLKTFSRMDDERQQVVDVRAVLASTINLCWNEIRHRTKLEKDLSDAPPVEINEARLGQVFLNLLLYAVRALPEDCIDQNVLHLRTGTDEDGAALIEIRDTGPGLRIERISRVFDPYAAGSSGDGLGLSVCHNIVTRAGGSITVDTSREGTTFRVRLPAATRPSDRPAAKAPPAQVESGRRARILVVDDEPLVAKSLRRALREHDVTVVSSGREAIDALVAGAVFDLVLCDLMMPEVSGMDVYYEVQKARPGVEQRFIFMTGGAFTPRAREFLQNVPNDRIDKPFDLARVRQMIAERAQA